MVDSYRIQHAYFVDSNNPEYRGPWNEVHSSARVFTPADTAVQTPNSDTPYSMLGADLRAEPLVLTVPPIEEGRYFSVQFIDGYTYNFAYVGSRTTGNGGGKYLLAGPGWNGEKPAGIDQVIKADTEFALGSTAPSCSGPTTSTTSRRSRRVTPPNHSRRSWPSPHRRPPRRSTGRRR